jgi:4-amino-4-deoxy-L-arabinose transferase-like glycosyltransferase
VRRSNTFWLAGLAALACAVRVAFLFFIARSPGFEWVDPDGYTKQGQLLRGGETGWHWTIEAVRYSGPYFKAPLYQAFLSLFVDARAGYFWTAALAQALLGGLATVAVWSLGRDLHSERAGWIAASVYAVYFPAVASMHAFMQEQLYVPLLITAFAAAARAMTAGRWWGFLGAGVALGVAALARSMPVYFILPAAALIAWTQRQRRGRWHAAPIFLAGFVVVTIPYSVFLSRQVHQPILIENIGAYLFRGLTDRSRAPRTGEVAAELGRQFTSSPVSFVTGKAQLILGSFQLGGGRWLEVSGGLTSRATATAAKVSAHAFGDLPVVVFAICGPLGVVLARNRPIAALLALWMAVHFAMTSLSGYGGQRFRGPADWTLFVLGACVLAGQWQRPRLRTAVAAIFVSAAFGYSALATAAASLAGRADYAVRRWDVEAVRTAYGTDDIGFNAFPSKDVVSFRLTALDTTMPVPIRVFIDDVHVAEADVGPGGERFSVLVKKPRAFVSVQRRSPTRVHWLVEALDESNTR